MKFIVNLLLGIIFGFGLILSNIFEPKTVVQFLQMTPGWNPSLLFTIVGILAVSNIFAKLADQIVLPQKPFYFAQHENTLNRNLLVGSSLFGIGWGLSGLCVSTATLNLAFNNKESLLFFCFMFLGFYGQHFLKKITL